MISNLVSLAKLPISAYPLVPIFKRFHNEISELVSYKDWAVHGLPHLAHSTLNILHALNIVHDALNIVHDGVSSSDLNIDDMIDSESEIIGR